MDTEIERLLHTQAILDNAELLFGEDECRQAVLRLANEITEKMYNQYPLILAVMGGAVVFTGQLLPLLRFPLDFDYVHVSRYGNKLEGGNFNWLRIPQEGIAGRHVLILDDILDEGHTMAVVKQQIKDLGALSCSVAVFANKIINKIKPVNADYIGINVPDRYVFGYGMDVAGAWRNLGAVYALCK